MTFQKPLVYIPGDNEWTDCHRKNNGPFDPLERLAKIRAMFFPQATSLGQQTLAVIRQSDASSFTHMVENARWVTQNVLFVTVHVVGSNNNLRQNRDAAMEFLERNTANIAWINDAFAVAKRDNAPGIVLVMHADPDFRGKLGDGNGFTDTLETLAKQAADFGKPLLIVHGDPTYSPLINRCDTPMMPKRFWTTWYGWKSLAAPASMPSAFWSIPGLPCCSPFSHCSSPKIWSSCNANAAALAQYKLPLPRAGECWGEGGARGSGRTCTGILYRCSRPPDRLAGYCHSDAPSGRGLVPADKSAVLSDRWLRRAHRPRLCPPYWRLAALPAAMAQAP